MTNSERKLDEAKYFFNLLNIDDPYFDYLLSAFLNASRSIGWVMRHEFNKVEGWEKWFNEYYLSDKAKQLMKDINELRIEATKKGGIKTDYFFLQTDLLVDEKYYPELDKIKNLEDGEYELSIEPPLKQGMKDLRDVVLSFSAKIDRSERPNTDAREKLRSKCDEYLNLMAEVVASCTEEFSLQREG